MSIFLKQFGLFIIPLLLVLFWLMHRGLLKGDIDSQGAMIEPLYCSSGADKIEPLKIWTNPY